MTPADQKMDTGAELGLGKTKIRPVGEVGRDAGVLGEGAAPVERQLDGIRRSGELDVELAAELGHPCYTADALEGPGRRPSGDRRDRVGGSSSGGGGQGARPMDVAPLAVQRSSLDSLEAPCAGESATETSPCVRARSAG
jgi:hypothetical protein